MTGSAARAGGLGAVAELLAAQADPVTEIELRCQQVREAYEAGRAGGWREGYEHGARLLDTEWPAVIAPMLSGRPDHRELERRRWALRGEQRTRETFGDPHPDDFSGRKLTAT